MAADLSDVVAFNVGRHAIKFGVKAARITARVTYGETTMAAFAQDDFRLSSRVSGNLGLRFEYPSVTTALHNLAPRAGRAWDVTGNGKTTVRAGGGILYDQLYLDIYRRIYLVGPGSPQTAYTIPFGARGFPEFPNSLTLPPTGASAGRLNLYIPGKNLVNPYSLQFSLGMEQQLPDHFVFTIDAIHAHTLKQYRADDINHPTPSIRTRPGQVQSGSAADSTRPYATYQGIPVRDLTVIDNSSSSICDALDFGIKRKFGRRYLLEGHYVLSSSATYAMFYADYNSGIPNEWNNWGSAERAPSDFFQHQRFVGSGTVDLPWGVRFGMVATAASGLPVNPLTGTDDNGDSYPVDRPIGFGRNSFRAPRQLSFDASLAKDSHMTERLHVETRAEFFNTLNHNSYITVNNVYGEGSGRRATFLQPTAGINNVDPSRQMQFGLRLLF